MKNPDEYMFAPSHEWISPDGNVGLSDHAQKEITDVVFVELPKVGKEVKAGEAVGVVESVKAAFDIYAPVSGTIEKVNQELVKNPALINQSPFGEGWIYILKKSEQNAPPSLMSHADYQKFLKDGKSH